jgi:FkbM family methyltransferase
MKRELKRGLVEFVQRRLHRWGYHIIRLGPDALGGDPYQDLANLSRPARPLVFDVGANLGQTVGKLRKVLPEATIHSFEPGPGTFAQLQKNCRDLPGVTLWNMGLGSQPGELKFYENSQSELSSFLPLGPEGWGEVQREVTVSVDTIDHFCQQHSIDFIDILKTDTQGFDLEVLKGAEQMLSGGRIGLVYTEISIAEIYQNGACLDELYGWMRGHGYRLVTFYRMAFRGGLASSTDALFAHPGYLKSPGR